VRERLRALVERLLPWYDLAAEARRAERSAAIHRRSIRARIRAEKVRDIAAAALDPDRAAGYGRVRIR
jgi:hypothetical protein